MIKNKDNEVDKYLLKIGDETYRIRQIFESCKTLEQVENTNRLSCAVLKKWFWHADKYGCAFAVHYIWPTINAATSDMEKFYREAKTRVIKNQ